MTTPTPEPKYKVGDVVNGHRLQSDHDGKLSWVPVTAGAPVNAATVEPKPKRAWYKRKAIIIPAAVLAFIIIIGSLNRPVSSDDATVSTPDAQILEEAKAAEKEEPAEPAKVTVPDVTGKTAAEATRTLTAAGFDVTPAEHADWIVTETAPAKGGIAQEGAPITLVTKAPAPKLTLAQENALRSAQSYLDAMSFSRAGLIQQLSSEYGEGYDLETATWATDAVGADWNAEAAESAASYLESQSFSRDGLYDQLTSEYGEAFTPEQAEFGLRAVGY